MPEDNKNVKQQFKSKDKEIMELKELLSEAEAEIKELNDFHGFQKPNGGILENRLLNKSIKIAAFVLACVAIVLIGIYPWLSGNKVAKESNEVDKSVFEEEVDNSSETESTTEVEELEDVIEEDKTEPEEVAPVVSGKKMFEVDSDLGWLNVRTEPDVETGLVIKKINSGELYEWLEKTDNNWYKIVLDEAGHTGYVSGEYVILK